MEGGREGEKKEKKKKNHVKKVIDMPHSIL